MSARRSTRMRGMAVIGSSPTIEGCTFLTNEADLNGVNLNGANLSKAKLSKANLRYADLSDRDLFKANLRDADAVARVRCL